MRKFVTVLFWAIVGIAAYLPLAVLGHLVEVVTGERETILIVLAVWLWAVSPSLIKATAELAKLAPEEKPTFNPTVPIGNDEQRHSQGE